MEKSFERLIWQLARTPFKEFFQIRKKNIETVWYPLSIFTDAICDVLGEFRFILFAFDLVVKSLGFVILKENNVFV